MRDPRQAGGDLDERGGASRVPPICALRGEARVRPSVSVRRRSGGEIAGEPRLVAGRHCRERPRRRRDHEHLAGGLHPAPSGHLRQAASDRAEDMAEILEDEHEDPVVEALFPMRRSSPTWLRSRRSVAPGDRGHREATLDEEEEIGMYDERGATVSSPIQAISDPAPQPGPRACRRRLSRRSVLLLPRAPTTSVCARAGPWPRRGSARRSAATSAWEADAGHRRPGQPGPEDECAAPAAPGDADGWR